MLTLYHLLCRAVRRALDIPKRGLPTLYVSNPSSFDRDFGTKTSGVVWLTNPGSKNFVHGIRYEPCNPQACRWAIECANIDPVDFWFVDVGCGKGRALLVAAQYAFPHLVGIEYSSRLCRQARENLAACSIPVERWEIICQDAADFRFAEHATFAYFYHPFDGDILQRVLENLRRVSQRHKVFVAYEGIGRHSLENCEWLQHVGSGNNTSVFSSVTP